MNAITANFANTNSRPTSSKLAAVLRALADMFEAKSVEQTTAKRKLESAMTMNRIANKYEAVQPNLAAELRFIASRG